MSKAIGVVTYIQNADFEDRLIKALVSDGVSEVRLEHRAVTESSLNDFFDSKPPSEARLILIHDQELVWPDAELVPLKFPNLTSLHLDSNFNQDPKEIEDIVNRTLRSFEAPTPKRRNVISRRNLIVITGTTGAPGVSTVAINLASEVARFRSTELVDAHPTRKDLGFLLGAKRSEDRVQLSKNLLISGSLEEESPRLQIVDAGPIPDLNRAFSDRRSEVSNYIDLLESAAQIIFLMIPDNNHMFELEAMLASFDARRFKGKPIFVMNQLGNSRRERSIYKRFQARVSAHLSFATPFDRENLDRAKAAYSPLLDVAPRSKLRRSLSELAGALIE